MFKFIIILVLFSLNSFNCLNLCGDWTQYKDIKCIKVLGKKGSEEEALSNCSQLDQRSTLLSIHSREEQEFLNNLLKSYKNISNNVWIGMKYINQSYRWIDGTTANYTNWSDESVREGIDPCVQISIIGTTSGKWTDVSCKKPGLIVCQKNQDINLNSLRDVMEKMSQVFQQKNQELEQQIQKLNKHISELINETKEQSIPLGFLYTQLPNQTSPQKLWPNMNWTEVTKEYAGLFFRAEGMGSEQFGTTQSANYSRISTLSGDGYRFINWETTINSIVAQTHELKEGWSENLLNCHGWVDRLQLYTTSGENRPRNTAIKIWKRIH